MKVDRVRLLNNGLNVAESPHSMMAGGVSEEIITTLSGRCIRQDFTGFRIKLFKMT